MGNQAKRISVQTPHNTTLASPHHAVGIITRCSGAPLQTWEYKNLSLVAPTHKQLYADACNGTDPAQRFALGTPPFAGLSHVVATFLSCYEYPVTSIMGWFHFPGAFFMVKMINTVWCW